MIEYPTEVAQRMAAEKRALQARVDALTEVLDDAVRAVSTARVAHTPSKVFTPHVAVGRVDRWRAVLDATSEEASP